MHCFSKSLPGVHAFLCLCSHATHHHSHSVTTVTPAQSLCSPHGSSPSTLSKDQEQITLLRTAQSMLNGIASDCQRRNPTTAITNATSRFKKQDRKASQSHFFCSRSRLTTQRSSTHRSVAVFISRKWRRKVTTCRHRLSRRLCFPLK